MIQAVQEVQETGEAMGNSAREFATDPCSSSKRGNMVMIYIVEFMHGFGVESYKLIYPMFFKWRTFSLSSTLLQLFFSPILCQFMSFCINLCHLTRKFVTDPCSSAKRVNRVLRNNSKFSRIYNLFWNYKQ